MRVARTEFLITKARILSTNTDFGDDYGIDDEPFIVSLCDAQIEVQSMIVEEDCQCFVGYKELDIVANQEAYQVPLGAFVENLVYGVDWSIDGDEKNYIPLDDGRVREDTYAGDPCGYVIDGGYIYLIGVPGSSQGTIRVRYEQALDKLDKRRGKIESFSIGATIFLPQTITLESGADETNLDLAEYVCVNSVHGEVKMRNIPVTWETASLTLTVESGWEAEDDSVGIAIGDYVTIGEDSTTHSKLRYIAEPYLVNAAAYDAIRLHSSTDAEDSNKKLTRLASRIKAIYEKLPSGKQSIIERRFY